MSVTCVCAQVSGVGPACQLMKLRNNHHFDLTNVTVTPIRYTGGQGVTELDAFCSVADEKLSITVSGRQ